MQELKALRWERNDIKALSWDRSTTTCEKGSGRRHAERRKPEMAHTTKKTSTKKLSKAAKAEAEAASHRPTPQQKEARIAEVEERARLLGDPVKQSAQAKVLERKWLRFLMVHGKAYGWDEKHGPTIALVEHFTSYCYTTRQYSSAIGREGLGDQFELQIRYMLAKFVFVSLKYKGWAGLTPHDLHVKAEQYKFAVREHWKRLKRSDEDLMSTLKPFVKTKWCDTAYFLAQVREELQWMSEGERSAIYRTSSRD